MRNHTWNKAKQLPVVYVKKDVDIIFLVFLKSVRIDQFSQFLYI